MSNNPNRLWILATALIAAAVIALGGFLGVAPLVASIALADLTRSGIESQNSATAAEIAALKKQSEQIDDLLDQVEKLELSVPAQLKMAEFANDVSLVSAQTGVSIKSIAVTSAAFYAPPAGTSGVATGDPAVFADPTLGGLVTPENFVVVQANATVLSADYAGFTRFVAGLQTMDRVFLVTDVQVTMVNGIYEASFSGLIYVLIDPSDPNAGQEIIDLVEGETPVAEPSSTPTPTPTGSGTPTPTSTETPAP